MLNYYENELTKNYNIYSGAIIFKVLICFYEFRLNLEIKINSFPSELMLYEDLGAKNTRKSKFILN